LNGLGDTRRSMKPIITAELRHLGGHSYQSQIIEPDGARICINNFDIKLDDPFLAYVDNYLENDAERPEERVEVGLLRRFGNYVFKLLAGEGEQFKDYIRLSPEMRGGFQFILSLDTDDGAEFLWRVPWEYMHDGDDFLGLSNKVSIVRQPHGLSRIKCGVFPRPLRILVVISSPQDLDLLDTEAEIEAIQSAVDNARLNGWIEISYLETATLSNLNLRIKEFDPHIIHYTGHGGKDPKTNETFLAFENDDWNSNPVYGRDLNRILLGNTTLRLIVLSGCMTAQTSYTDALRGVGTSLLKGNIPAILALHYSIPDKSGIKLAKILYESLAKGESIDQAVANVRLALYELRGEDRADWGLMALYLRSPEIRLIDPDTAPISLAEERITNIGDLPIVRGFVGRKKEIREIRLAVQQRRIPGIYIYGLGGIGKTALVAKAIEKLEMEHEISARFVVRCHKIEPTFAALVEKIANFISYQGKKNHAHAGQILRNSSIPIDERVSLLNNIIKNEKYLFVFDNFESLFSEKQAVLGKLTDHELERFFSVIFDHNWNSSLVFTSRIRWDLLGKLTQKNKVEIYLPSLSRAETIMLMNNLGQLKKLTLEQQKAVFPIVQGHPWAIELLNSYLKIATLDMVLKNKSLESMLIEEVGEYFMNALWDNLNQEEKDALSILSTFRLGLSDAEVEVLVGDAKPLKKLQGYSLLQREESEARLAVHPVVREYVLGKAGRERRKQLHSAAASFWIHRSDAFFRRPPTTDEKQLVILCYLMQELINQGENDEADAAMVVLLEIHHHLFEAGEYKKAGRLAMLIYDILGMQGMRDLAKDLIQKSINTLEGFDKFVAKGNLATLLGDEGKWDEPLALHQECCGYFKGVGAKPQMAASLIQQGVIYQQQGEYETAMKLQMEGLRIAEEIEDKEAIIIARYRITQLLYFMGKYKEALEKGNEGLELVRQYGNKRSEDWFLNLLGMTLKSLGRPKEAIERFRESLEISWKMGHQDAKAVSLAEIGKLLIVSGCFKEALNFLQQAHDIFVELNDPQKIAANLESIGILFAIQEYHEEALIKFEEALELQRQFGSPQEIAVTERNIARVREKLKEGEEN